MDLFQWKEEYSVKIKLFERHHQHLFALVNELHDFMTTGQGDGVMRTTLDQLVRYTREHFAAEEVLMEAFAFPGLTSHRWEHANLCRKLDGFVRGLEAGEQHFSAELMSFLVQWLTHHILETDLRYSDFMVAKGAA